MASKTDANGNTETYAYDVYQRLTSIPDRQQTFTYDTCPAAARGCVSMAGHRQGVGKTLQLTGGVGIETAVGTVAANYAFDGQGALTQTSYTPAYFVNTFNYTLDAMERPTGMTDNLSHTWVTGATYNAANQMTSNGTHTWTYNSLYQITGVTGTGMNMTYNYSATQNNGQIASSVDSVKSETIDYQYDLLKRLSSATATSGAWGESYVYDGYGNLTQMNPSGTAGAPSMNLTVQTDANGVPTNQITGSYDNNGNLKWLGNNTSLSYDAANRLDMVLANGQFSYYGYDADNRRVWYQNASGVQTIYFYGADGRKVTSYTFTMSAPNIVMTPAQNYGNIYFAGVPLETEGNAVSTDRLGSVRNGGPGGVCYQAEYPYGIEYSLTANDREKYATYTRDSITGLDYAVNRYYWSQWGRFISPDPSSKSIRRRNPQSWNRYAYAGDDPVNQFDPTGLTNWGTVLNGTLTLGGGILSGAGAITVGMGSGGLALPGAIFLGITAAGGLASGVGQIVAGFTDTPVPPTMANVLSGPIAIVTSVITFGNPIVTQVGGYVNQGVVTVADIGTGDLPASIVDMATVASQLLDVKPIDPTNTVIGNAPSALDLVSSPSPDAPSGGLQVCGPNESWDGEGCIDK